MSSHLLSSENNEPRAIASDDSKELLSLQKLFKNVPGAIYQFQLFDDGRVCFPYVSEGAKAIFGHTAKEIMLDASIVFSMIHPDDFTPYLKARDLSITTLSTINFDFRIVRSPDDIVWININSTPERLSDSVLWHGYIQDITEKKRREEQIVRSENKYRHIIEGSLNGFTIGRDGVTLDANEAAVKMFGYESIEELRQLRREDVIQIDEKYLQLRRNRSVSGKAKGQITGIKKDGTRFPCLMVSTHSEDDDGKLLTLNFFIDMSEHALAEEKLARSQQLLSQAEAIAKIGSSEIDYKTGKFLWSDEFYRIHGLEPNCYEPTPEISESFLHPDEKYKIKLFDEAPLKKLERLEFDSKIIRADGMIREVSSLWRLQYDSDGKPLKMYGVVQDITERKQLEEALKLSEEQFRGAFEYSAMGLALVGSDFRWMAINESLCQMLGYTKDELMQLTLEDISQPDDLAFAKQQIYETLAARKNSFSMEKRYLHKNGSIIWAMVVLSVIRDDIGDISHFVAQIENITPRMEQEQALKKLNAELALRAEELMDSNVELERFAYVASHDLQEPLRMISSFLQLLQKKYSSQLDEKANEFINYAVDGAKRMKALILDMLEYSRVNSVAIEPEEVDLNTVVDEVRLNLMTIIHNEKANLIVGELPIIKGIKTQLFQLLQNLIGNAIKYKSKDRHPHIFLNATEENDQWIVTVQDNGMGIDKQYNEKIFEIFQRLHNKTEYSGTGIGLAICKKIVEKHGGKIGVTSEVGVGSTFYFSLPKK